MIGILGGCFICFECVFLIIILVIILVIILASSWSAASATVFKAIILPECCYHPGHLPILRVALHHPGVILAGYRAMGFYCASSWHHPASHCNSGSFAVWARKRVLPGWDFVCLIILVSSCLRRRLVSQMGHHSGIILPQPSWQGVILVSSWP